MSQQRLFSCHKRRDIIAHALYGCFVNIVLSIDSWIHSISFWFHVSCCISAMYDHYDEKVGKDCRCRCNETGLNEPK